MGKISEVSGVFCGITWSWSAGAPLQGTKDVSQAMQTVPTQADTGGCEGPATIAADINERSSAGMQDDVVIVAKRVVRRSKD